MSYLLSYLLLYFTEHLLMTYKYKNIIGNENCIKEQYHGTFKPQNMQKIHFLNIGCRNETYNLQHIKMQRIN